MTAFVNNNSHPVRVEDELGKLRRITPGQVVEADGKYADNLEATTGVDSATTADERSFDDANEARRTEHDGGGTRIAAKAALGAAAVAVRQHVHAPLRRVVGDDAAPAGPPSGTVITKGEAAAEDKAAFAPHERLGGDDLEHGTAPDPHFQGAFSDALTSEDIEQAQADNAAAADEAAKRYIGEGSRQPAATATTADAQVKAQEPAGGSAGGAESGAGGAQASSPESTGSVTTPYDSDANTVKALQAEAERRGISKSGNKAQLAKKLDANDKEQ